VSRPTNPTGNVLTDDEMEHLAALARDRGIPLIIDNAYGLPFPGIIFGDARPMWDDNTILCMSLSKIGLPAVRTGIVIANERVIDALTGMNSIFSLAVSSVGAVLMREFVETGEIVRLGRDVIQPFYRERAEQALDWMHAALSDCEYFIHRPEGAFFLWLWLPEMSITSGELYQRLKDRGVYVIPGHHFFPGLDDPWPHRDQCIRISYSQDAGAVEEGIRIIGEEARKASC
jgi:valine--pyruvate aminotransferase